MDLEVALRVCALMLMLMDENASEANRQLLSRRVMRQPSANASSGTRGRAPVVPLFAGLPTLPLPMHMPMRMRCSSISLKSTQIV